MTTNTGTAFIGRVLEPDNSNLSPEAARALPDLDFRRKDHNRMEKLSAKASAGRLAADEHEELDEYLRVADLLVLLQSRARLSLKRARINSCSGGYWDVIQHAPLGSRERAACRLGEGAS
jgi:hypothetical protein